MFCQNTPERALEKKCWNFWPVFPSAPVLYIGEHDDAALDPLSREWLLCDLQQQTMERC